MRVIDLIEKLNNFDSNMEVAIEIPRNDHHRTVTAERIKYINKEAVVPDPYYKSDRIIFEYGVEEFIEHKDYLLVIKGR